MNDGSDLPFRRVAILGLGLMGGSLGLALKEVAGTAGRRGSLNSGDPLEVVGWNRTTQRVHEAVRGQVIDCGAATIESAVSGADLVVIATPVSTIAKYVEEVMPTLDEDAVITDVGSVKGVIVAAVESRVERAGRFVGGHPMCGSELAGLNSAEVDLYRGANWILTPTDSTDDEAFSRLQVMLRKLGANVIAVDPDGHDRFVAIVSHVPHLTAASLLSVADSEAASAEVLLHLAAGGFRDVTRVASGSSSLWTDICSANRDAVGRALGMLIDELMRVRGAVIDGDLEGLAGFLEAASAARARLPVGGGVEGPLFEVIVPVSDRPGVVAEVSTLIGSIGVNIGDISIAHSVEGGGGLLTLLISGESEAERAAEALRKAGYSEALRPIETDPAEAE